GGGEGPGRNGGERVEAGEERLEGRREGAAAEPPGGGGGEQPHHQEGAERPAATWSLAQEDRGSQHGAKARTGPRRALFRPLQFRSRRPRPSRARRAGRTPSSSSAATCG